MPDPSALVILAASARALAASARRGGYAPLAIDLFGDEDTRELSRDHCVLGRGFAPDAIDAVVAEFVREYAPIGLVYGSGLEDRPEIVEMLERRLPVFGNSAATVALTKDPFEFARLCAQSGVDHPEVCAFRPADPGEWLAKLRGGAGGWHISPAPGHPGGEGIYFQRRVAGESISALVLADGARARVLGLSAQWSDPTEEQPFRYGGAVGPIEQPPSVVGAIHAAVAALTLRLGLAGLNAFDFLIEGSRVRLIEINPRPGATLDVFEPEVGARSPSLLHLHIRACCGALSDDFAIEGARAARVVHAPHDARLESRPAWPDWAVDRPPRSGRVRAGEPFCTVLARGAHAKAARDLVEERARAIVAMVAGEGRDERGGG